MRDERCFWQGVCSLLMSPEILDLVHLHPASSLEGEGGYFQSSCFEERIFPFPVPKFGSALLLPRRVIPPSWRAQELLILAAKL